MFKSPLSMSLTERKSDIINQCYIRMADQDYVAARWAFTSGIFHNFYWSAAQCIEKYTKAALLYNECSTKGFDHNLNAIFSALGQIEPGILTATIEMPCTSGLGRNNWEMKPLSLFVDYLNQYGSPNARYSLGGTFVNGPVVHPLDQICVFLRAIIRRKNFMSADLFQSSQANICVEQRLQDPLKWMLNLDFFLERLYFRKFEVGQSEKLRDAFSNMNFAFFNEQTQNESTFGGQHFSTSPLQNHLVRLYELDESVENRTIINELRTWTEKNIRMPKDLKAKIAISNTRSRRETDKT